MDKNKAQLLYAEGVRLKDKDSITHSFITQNQMNPKITKPVVYISLDFSMQDKKRLTDKAMVGIALEYMQKMRYNINRVACKLHVLQEKKQLRISS